MKGGLVVPRLDIAQEFLSSKLLDLYFVDSAKELWNVKILFNKLTASGAQKFQRVNFSLSTIKKCLTEF